jgi:hypothetical protein
MTIRLEDEEWTAEDLFCMTLSELRALALECGQGDVRGLAKADVVSLLLTGELPMPTPESFLTAARQLRQWVRGVPPPYACLKAEDKSWMKHYGQYIPLVALGCAA